MSKNESFNELDIYAPDPSISPVETAKKAIVLHSID
jgi:hypothetical protein